jgi:hypothetical protein
MRRGWRLRVAMLGSVAAVAVGMLATAPVSAATAAPAVTPAGPVTGTPPANLPHLLTGPPAANIRQLVQCGGTMYAVGNFTQIKRNSTVYNRTAIFSFSATPPYAVTSWAPNISGTINSIVFSGTNCANAYIGGHFTIGINGANPAKNIAEISTTARKVITTFAHNASAQVDTLTAYQSHIIAGGHYTSINGSAADPYMTSLNSSTGKDDGFLQLHISGNYNYPGVATNPTRVYNQALSHSKKLDLVMGDFTTVDGHPRQQIFMLNFATRPHLTGWTSPEFDGSAGNIDQQGGFPYQCVDSEPMYIQSAAWSPDDSTVFIADTGFHPWNVSENIFPHTGLCDAAAAFPATQSSVLHKWVNYTGCDSLFSAAADSSAAYFGGHQRWSQNQNGCGSPGPEAVANNGLEGLAPGTGLTLVNSGGQSPYTRSRGQGADAMLLTSSGLWIGSDNGNFTTINGQQVWQTSQSCGGVNGLAGICFLPYPGH